MPVRDKSAARKSGPRMEAPNMPARFASCQPTSPQKIIQPSCESAMLAAGAPGGLLRSASQTQASRKGQGHNNDQDPRGVDQRKRAHIATGLFTKNRACPGGRPALRNNSWWQNQTPISAENKKRQAVRCKWSSPGSTKALATCAH